jgi:hypothetical protein
MSETEKSKSTGKNLLCLPPELRLGFISKDSFSS